MVSIEPQPSTPTGRFEVSESGMRELNISRQPWDLVKELIQNAWDEAPFATECRVTVDPQPDGNSTMVTVEDDGSGFRDIADAYTLMGPTRKRLDHMKRGRFNIGEKDVISVAIKAEVETVEYTVTFPSDPSEGLRKVAANSREKGTVVRVLMPWDKQQSDELVAMLQRFRPPVNCRLFVNDCEVSHTPPKARCSVALQTIIQDAPDKPMQTTQRRTDIHFAEPPYADGERWLYEMGIPVQTIECPWDVDVMQKIPMGQQRNAVSEAYLNRIYAEALNTTHGMLEQEEFGAQWVKRAIEHPQIKPAAVRATVKGRYGSAKTVFETLDGDANLRASEAGYGVANPGGLSKKEIEALRKNADVKDSDEVFPTPPPARDFYEPKPGTDLARFADWVTEMAGHCNLTATVYYFNEPNNARLADCSASTDNPTLRFNEGRLGETFFQLPYGRIEHWDLLLHELGHALSNQSAIGHGEAWGDGVSKAGAFIAVHMLQDKGE